MTYPGQPQPSPYGQPVPPAYDPNQQYGQPAPQQYPGPVYPMPAPQPAYGPPQGYPQNPQGYPQQYGAPQGQPYPVAPTAPQVPAPIRDTTDDGGASFFNGGGYPTLKWLHRRTPHGAPMGTVFAGTICDKVFKSQRTEFIPGPPGQPPKQGAPLFFKNGEPKMQLVIPIQTELRDPTIVNDDGKRTVYVSFPNDKNLGAAVMAAGVGRLDVDGHLQVKWVSGSGEAGDGRIFEYRYTPPGRPVVPLQGLAPQPAQPGYPAAPGYGQPGQQGYTSVATVVAPQQAQQAWHPGPLQGQVAAAPYPGQPNGQQWVAPAQQASGPEQAGDTAPARFPGGQGVWGMLGPAQRQQWLDSNPIPGAPIGGEPAF